MKIENEILITGSCGCIGEALKARLGAGFDEIDLRLGTDHNNIINRAGTLVYLSSWSEQSESLRLPVKYLDNNLTALATILSNNSFDRVVFPSSTAVYDANGELEPNSVYGLTKLAGEKLIKMFCKRCWIFRFANVYGLHDRRSVFHHLAQCKKEGKVFTIYRHNGMIRDYMSAADAVSVIDGALQGDIVDGTYNVGAGVGINIAEVLERICIRYEIQYELVSKPNGVADGYIPTQRLLRFEPKDLEEEWATYYL